MLTAKYKKHILRFRFPAGTSRGILYEKPSYYLVLSDNNFSGIGECSIIPGLSIDDHPDYEYKISQICSLINDGKDISNLDLRSKPSIEFGLETAILDLQNQGKKILYKSDFTSGKSGLKINGLVWMGKREFMESQIKEKINKGFNCIKLKIGALNFQTELEILKAIRKKYPPEEICLRLDANGAFSPENALEKLKLLSEFNIHSVEQPIKQGQAENMAEICSKSPVPIALDEELINLENKEEFLKMINPQFLVLKPGLLGGIKKSEEFIRFANQNNIGWWVTSALESNIGLNAIAQWTSTLNNNIAQGLGTGQLYLNNIPSPLFIREGMLFYIKNSNWDLKTIL